MKQSINWIQSVFVVAGIGLMMAECVGIGEPRLKVNGFGEGAQANVLAVYLLSYKDCKKVKF